MRPVPEDEGPSKAQLSPGAQIAAVVLALVASGAAIAFIAFVAAWAAANGWRIGS